MKNGSVCAVAVPAGELAIPALVREVNRTQVIDRLA